MWPEKSLGAYSKQEWGYTASEPRPGGGWVLAFTPRRWGEAKVIGQAWRQQVRGGCGSWARPGELDRTPVRFQAVTAALWAPRSWPCPSHTGKGQVLPAPMEAPPCAGLACGWPLAGLLPHLQWCWHLHGIEALGPAPDGVGCLGGSSFSAAPTPFCNPAVSQTQAPGGRQGISRQGSR